MFFADLHIHSRFSRATSRECDLAELAFWAVRKGIRVLATGDFTHPEWFALLGQRLVPAEPGLYRLEDAVEREVAARLPARSSLPVRFMLQAEISTIYKRDGRTRKVHHVVYAPDLATVSRMNAALSRIGNLASDGRPILGLDSRDLLEIVLSANEAAYLVPAHIWTPWFSVLGAKSGFDGIEDCYRDLTPHVFALETGLSSDPPMNWRVSALGRYRLVSNSDAHSPPKLGREACVFETDLDYFAMRRALETGRGYGGTVEFFPEEGKYHLDGHRKCGVCLAPEETRRCGAKCPVCGRAVTVGVMNRVCELADRPEGHKPEGTAGFRSAIPLVEILGELLGVGPATKTVARAYDVLLARHGSEFAVLWDANVEDLEQTGPPRLGEAIHRMRTGRVTREPGYDGEYGRIRVLGK